MFKVSLRCASLAALSALAFPTFAETDKDVEPALQDVVIVTTKRVENAAESKLNPELMPHEGVDLSLLVSRTPGGARVGNGALSGQVQYRGLFGERLNLRVDGQQFASGGPNLMDPVFHYAPASLVSQLIIDRGISPVSAGPGLAGGADAIFKKVDFNDSADLSFGYDLSAGFRTGDNSTSTGGVIGASTDVWRFNLIGSYEDGDDYDYPEGTVRGSRFNRSVYGFSSGLKLGAHTISLDARRQNTGASGNPPFPMDIRYFDADFVQLKYLGDFEAFDVKASLQTSDVAHAMNNYDFRPTPAMSALRETYASAETKSGALSVLFSALSGKLELGLDGNKTDHDVLITNPANANFFVSALPQIEMQRLGVFGEWTGKLGGWNTQFGLLVDQHEAEGADASVGSALPMGPRMLLMAYNAADRSDDDTTVDAVARFWSPERGGVSWRATLAHKTQVPNYLQKFGWMPLPASGGLADGNIYVGDLNLDPEEAWILEGGFDYRGDKLYARPTLFLRQIDNYIQGVPFDDTVGVIDSTVEMIANMNGDPTPMRFANVDARLYGFDVDFGYDMDGPWRLDGVLSYVRGERRDIDDNLYRVAPPNLTLAATYEKSNWATTFEVRGFATQDEVSLTNSEQETPGYAVFNLYGDWQVRDGIHLSAGVENLFDHTYRDHLAGYNRIAGSDVPVGTRLPGAGQTAFLRISFTGRS